MKHTSQNRSTREDIDENTNILGNEDTPSNERQPLAFEKNYTDDNNGNGQNKIQGPQEEENHDNYVYIAKFSPLCACARKCLIGYIVIVILANLVLALNIKVCGLDTPIHTVTIRNITALTGSYGIICPNYTTICEFPTYFGVPDVITNITYNSTHFNQNPITTLGNETNITLQNMPMAILINNTKNMTSPKKQTLKGIQIQPVVTLQQIDNGGRVSIDIQNSKRKRLLTSSPYFNTGFWLDEYRFNGSEIDISVCSSFVTAHPVIDDNSTVPFNIQAPTNNTTQIPIWVINLDTAINSQYECCMQNYTLTISHSNFYCLSPLVVRDLDDINVLFKEVRMIGDYIFDFVSTRGFITAYNSTVNRIWLLRQNMTYLVYAQRSTITFLIPKRGSNVTTFYGIAGNITTTQGQRSISRLEYHVYTEMNNTGQDAKLTIQILDNTLDSTLLSYITCAFPNCTTILLQEGNSKSESTFNFIQQDETDTFNITVDELKRIIMIN